MNNPASAEGFTVIFSKARDEKKTNGAAAGGGGAQNIDNHKQDPNFPDTPLVFTILILESSKYIYSTTGFSLKLLMFPLHFFIFFIFAEEVVLLFLKPLHSSKTVKCCKLRLVAKCDSHGLTVGGLTAEVVMASFSLSLSLFLFQ